MTDPLWNEYVDAVRNLGKLPALKDERRRQATSREQASVRRAKAALETELRHCEDWSVVASRAMSTAEAMLVKAQVLVPDVAAAPVMPSGAPAELAGIVQQTERELASDLIAVDTARRRAKQRAIERAQRAKELAARRRAIIKFAVLGGAFVVVLLVIAVVFS